MVVKGRLQRTPTGVPQGGPLSPLLANILLDDLDKELEKRGQRFARYADDFIILVKSLILWPGQCRQELVGVHGLPPEKAR